MNSYVFREERRGGKEFFFFFFFLEINKITSFNETKQLQRAKAHRKCAKVNVKTNKTKMHEKYNYQGRKSENTQSHCPPKQSMEKDSFRS